VRMDQKRKATLLSGTTIACGVLGFALLMWTPRTGSGILVYVVLLAVLAITAMVLFSRKNRDHDS
jgi:type IV secretory pathway TrbD component